MKSLTSITVTFVFIEFETTNLGLYLKASKMIYQRFVCICIYQPPLTTTAKMLNYLFFNNLNIIYVQYAQTYKINKMRR